MKKFLIIIGVIILAAVVTNPNELKHQEAVSKEYAKILGVDPDHFLFDMISTQITKKVVEVDNYYLFSITKLGDTKIGIGIFTKNFIFSDRLTKKINEL